MCSHQSRSSQRILTNLQLPAETTLTTSTANHSRSQPLTLGLLKTLERCSHTTHAHLVTMKRNIVIFLIILILFILIALIAYLIYYLQTRMAVGGTATSSGSDMTSVA
jgi:hypothetical protein